LRYRLIMKIKDKVIVIVGPTSSGKSEWAVALAQKLNGEVISADARQVYRGLNIGTGKITEREKQGINHHLLDVANPHRKFSASDFKRLGEKAITKIRKKNRLPIIAGGTGFYIDVLLDRIPLPAIKPNAKLRQSLEKLDTKELYNQLNKLDPRRAKTIDRHNRPRLIRAIEIAKELGQVPTIKIKKTDDQKVLWLGIKTNHQELKEKISNRLKKRLRQGLIAEVKNLRQPIVGRGLSNKRLWALGLEYRYINLYLENQLSKTEMLSKLEQEIIKYAKRQMTWFKANQQINWAEDYQSAEKLVKHFLEN
jgi:tRNA dimethylallyltransferase